MRPGPRRPQGRRVPLSLRSGPQPLTGPLPAASFSFFAGLSLNNREPRGRGRGGSLPKASLQRRALRSAVGLDWMWMGQAEGTAPSHVGRWTSWFLRGGPYCGPPLPGLCSRFCRERQIIESTPFMPERPPSLAWTSNPLLRVPSPVQGLRARTDEAPARCQRSTFPCFSLSSL